MIHFNSRIRVFVQLIKNLLFNLSKTKTNSNTIVILILPLVLVPCTMF